MRLADKRPGIPKFNDSLISKKYSLSVLQYFSQLLFKI